MKVKFELDISERFFDEISENAYKNDFKINLNDLFKDKKGMVSSISKERDTIYGLGLNPISVGNYTRDEINLIIIE